jgi:short-subunit dehydrogenase
MATNWTSHFSLCQQLKPLLARGALERGSASIVLNTSVAGVVAISSGSLYAAAKVRSRGWRVRRSVVAVSSVAALSTCARADDASP